MKVRGITIEGKHTSEFGLKLLSFQIPLPSVNEELIEVPGMSGALDATEVATGYPTFAMRSGLSFVFKMYADWIDFEALKSQLAEWIHGKKVRVVLDSDPSYYYLCRLSLDTKKTNKVTSTITISGKADPLKYEITSSDEDWLWDPFSFETGVIRELAGIEITPTNTIVTILAGDYSVSPTFKVEESINLAVIHNEYTYPLPVGDTKIPCIRVGDEDVTLTFSGQGKLSISYRGEVL